ncbi:hypothetical protein ACWGQ5_41260 [Streptomyces sp. NPDC055722]
MRDPTREHGRRCSGWCSGSKDVTSPAAVRLPALLNTFDPAVSAVSLVEVDRGADLLLTTGRRLGGELVAWGALERDVSGDCHIGLRLLGEQEPCNLYTAKRRSRTS